MVLFYFARKVKAEGVKPAISQARKPVAAYLVGAVIFLAIFGPMIAGMLETVRDVSTAGAVDTAVDTAVTDGSNGSISPASGTTDSSGQVSVQFIAGALSTATDGVVVRGTVQGTSVSGTASLTVSGQALFISRQLRPLPRQVTITAEPRGRNF